MKAQRLLGRLPVLWKILLPFVVLVLLVGPLAAFLVARDVSSRADAALNRALTSGLLDARARVQDRGLYVFEAASQAANLQGMADAVARGDGASAAALLQSVLALKSDVTLLEVASPEGVPVARFTRPRPEAEATRDDGGPAVGSSTGARSVTIVDHRLLVTVPVCAGADGCTGGGSATAGIDLGSVLPASDGGAAAIYRSAGALLVASGPSPADAPASTGEVIRRRHELDGQRMATVFGPFEVDGQRLGSLAVTLPVDGAYGSSGWSLRSIAALLLLAMGAVMAIGVLVARSVLAQVRVLHRTSQELGHGNLSSRAPILADDEIGDLARVLNQMADELQASHEHLEARVEARTAEVSRLLQERTEFFASLSHELRTPLAVILSQARIQLDPSFSERRGSPVAAWKTIEASADHLLHDVNAVLDLARTSSGRMQVSERDVDARELVTRVHETFDALAERHAIALDVDIPDQPVPARLDAQLVQEALANLVDNGVKYTPAGGRVLIALRVDEHTIELAVTDSGIGVPPEAAERIFEPFVRAAGVVTQHGEPSTGLGLTVARRLVELHGGTIQVGDAPGGGSTFTITLPRRPAEAPTSELSPSHTSLRSTSSGRQGPAG